MFQNCVKTQLVSCGEGFPAQPTDDGRRREGASAWICKLAGHRVVSGRRPTGRRVTGRGVARSGVDRRGVSNRRSGSDVVVRRQNSLVRAGGGGEVKRMTLRCCKATGSRRYTRSVVHF